MRNYRCLLLALGLFCLQGLALASVKEPPKDFAKETRECVKCHKKNDPGIVQQWAAQQTLPGPCRLLRMPQGREGRPGCLHP